MPTGQLVRAQVVLGAAGLIVMSGAAALAQDASAASQTMQTLPTGKIGGSANMHLVAHVPLGGKFRVTDADLEQELSRPYAYLGGQRDQIGLAVIDLHDLTNVKLLYHWHIDNMALHTGLGTL